MACAGDYVGCVAGEAIAGSVVGGVAVVTSERPNMSGNRAVAASAGDSVAVSMVVMKGEEEC